MSYNKVTFAAMARKKKSKKASENTVNEEEEYKKYPHSFVFHRGKIGKNIFELVRDTRRLMEPYTASSLKVKKNNVLRDFVNVAGPLNVTHFIIYTKTKISNYMRVMRLPRGPTLTFKIQSYSLMRDVVSSLKKFTMHEGQFHHHPLLVMNNFSGDGMHLKLMASMFQNLFPSLNVNKINLADIQRCVLLNYRPEDDTIDFRHYNIKTVPMGVSRGVKKIVKAEVPNLSNYNDISEFLLRAGEQSESEAELDGEHNEVILPQAMPARGNIKSTKSAIRLTEIGPRLRLQLVKIEEGLCDGEVMYHKYIQKSEEEKTKMTQRRNKKRLLKVQRKKQQEDNVKRKEQEKEARKDKCIKGMNQPSKQENSQDFEEVDASHTQGAAPTSLAQSDSDDDAAYYRQEVGQEPESELNLGKKSQGKKRKSSDRTRDVDAKRIKKTNTTKQSGKTNTTKQSGPKENDKKYKKIALSELDKIKQRKAKKEYRQKLDKKRNFNKKRPKGK